MQPELAASPAHFTANVIQAQHIGKCFYNNTSFNPTQQQNTILTGRILNKTDQDWKNLNKWHKQEQKENNDTVNNKLTQ